MKTRKLLLIVSLVLAMTMSLGGTLAYLQDTDADVNTMVLGNVQIVQNEQQWNDEKTELVAFEQDKPLLPYVGNLGWENKEQDGGAYRRFTMSNVVDKYVTVTNSGNTDAYIRTIIAVEMGEYANVADFKYKVVGTSTNAENGAEFDFTGAWKWSEEFVAQINGQNYMIMTATHQDAVKAKDTTIPSLLQVYVNKDCDNDDLIKLDGNKNGKLDVLVISQAVQSAGFEDAGTALDEAFKAVSAEKVKEWFEKLVDEKGNIKDANLIGSPSNDGVNDKWPSNDVPKFYDYVVTNLDELKAALAQGGAIQLANDIKIDKITAIEPGKEVYLDLNGKTITVDQNTTSNTLLYVKEGAKLVIDGNGTIDLEGVSTMAIFAPYGELVIENGTFTRDEITTVTKKTTGLFMGAQTTASNVTINGGYFDGGYYNENAANIEDILAGKAEFVETADDIAKRNNSKDANAVRVALKDNVSVLLNHSGYGTFKVYGGTFVGANPAWGDEGCMLPTTPNYLRPWSYYQGALLDGQTFNENGIVLPAGYSITNGTTADGVPTYTVNYSK